MDLSTKKCVTCEAGTLPMNEEQIKKYFPQTPNWLLYGNKIIRQFEFKNFKESLEFVNKVAEIAESEGHHPDIYILYHKVKLELYTHAANGLTENDFIVAVKVDQLLKNS